MTNTIDLDKLERAANKAAESGEWPFYWKAFYDCATPAVVLELVRRLRAAEAACISIAGNPHGHLGDMIYQVKECEGLGWDGPAVLAWNKAVSDLNSVVAAIAAQGASHD